MLIDIKRYILWTFATLQSPMCAELRQQRFWHCYENGIVLRQPMWVSQDFLTDFRPVDPSEFAETLSFERVSWVSRVFRKITQILLPNVIFSIYKWCFWIHFNSPKFLDIINLFSVMTSTLFAKTLSFVVEFCHWFLRVFNSTSFHIKAYYPGLSLYI